MEIVAGSILAVLGLLAAYFYARSTRFESDQFKFVVDEKTAKVAALEAELSIKRSQEKERDAREAAEIVAGGDAAAAAEFLSDSFGPRRGPPN